MSLVAIRFFVQLHHIALELMALELLLQARQQFDCRYCCTAMHHSGTIHHWSDQPCFQCSNVIY